MATLSTPPRTIDPSNPPDLMVFLGALLSHAQRAHVNPEPVAPPPETWQIALSRLYYPPSPEATTPLRVFEAGAQTARYSRLYEGAGATSERYAVLARDPWEGRILMFLCALLRQKATLSHISKEITATMGPGCHPLEETIRIMFNGRQRLEVTLVEEHPDLESYDIYTYPRVSKECAAYLVQLSK